MTSAMMLWTEQWCALQWLDNLNSGLRPKLSGLVSVFGLSERLIEKVKWLTETNRRWRHTHWDVWFPLSMTTYLSITHTAPAIISKTTTIMSLFKYIPDCNHNARDDCPATKEMPEWWQAFLCRLRAFSGYYDCSFNIFITWSKRTDRWTHQSRTRYVSAHQ